MTKQKEAWQMTKAEFMDSLSTSMEPIATIPGEVEEVFGGDIGKPESARAALFSSEESEYYIVRDDGSKVFNPETHSQFFKSWEKAWDEYRKQEVSKALSECKPVPAEVLEYYPKLPQSPCNCQLSAIDIDKIVEAVLIKIRSKHD